MVYLRQVGRKQANASWVTKGESPRTVVRRDRFESKWMFSIFFKSTGRLLSTYLEKGETIDHRNYIEKSLKPLVNSINEQKPSCGKKYIKFEILIKNGEFSTNYVRVVFLEFVRI